jgi:hypothetical protein
MKTILTTTLLASPLTHAASLVGLWTFDNPANLGEPTIGNDLTFEGTAPTYSASLADDQSDVQTGVITTVLGADNRINAVHGIAPNGGGSFVNQYSILVDLFSPVGSRDSWRTIYQTNTTNANDGEFFIRPENNQIGVSALGYSTNEIDETSWTRLVLTVDLAKDGEDVLSYTDGALFHAHPADSSLDSRFSLDPSLLFFTDENGDDSPLHVGAVALFDGALSPAQVATLGAAGAVIPEPSSLALLMMGGLGLARHRRRSR